MSHSLAGLLAAGVRLATRPLSPRQRRRVLARLADRLASGQWVDVDTLYGPLRLNPLAGAAAASAVSRFFEDEPSTLAWIDSFDPPCVLWDVGANIGTFALYAALRPGVTVIAFEPVAANYALLVEHLLGNDLGDRVTPLCLALSDSSGIVPLHLSQLDAGQSGNAIGRPMNQFGAFTARASHPVPVCRGDDAMDWFELPAPTHLKLDIDGLEPAVLAGAHGLLGTVESVLVEVQGCNAEADAAAVRGPLAAAGLEEDLASLARDEGNRLFRRRRPPAA